MTKSINIVEIADRKGFHPPERPLSMKVSTRRFPRLPVVALASVLTISSLALVVGESGPASASKAKAREVTTLRYEPFPTILNFPELAESLGYLKGIKLDDVGEDQN